MDDKSKLSQLEILMADLLIKQGRMEETLEKHAEKLDEHTSILNEHTNILNEHTNILNQHTLQFGSILAKLELISEGQNRTEEHFKVAIDLFRQMAEDLKELKDGVLSDHEARLRTLESIVLKAS
jgi:ABC-type transporter Mla subunit MlaD